MSVLLLGLVIFLGVHVVPHFRALRSAWMGRWGQAGYRAGFAVLSFVGFGLIVWGKSQAPYVHVLSPPVWGRHLTMGLMLLAVVGLVGAYLPTNLKRWTAHPMLWGTALWAIAHLMANGDLASLLLFGSFLVFSLFDVWSANRRGAHRQATRVPWWKELVLLLVAALVYAALLWLHPHLFGVAVLRG